MTTSSKDVPRHASAMGHLIGFTVSVDSFQYPGGTFRGDEDVSQDEVMAVFKELALTSLEAQL